MKDNCETNIYEVPRIERYFNEESGVSIEQLFSDFIQLAVELNSRQRYDFNKVDVATSDEGVA